MARLNENLIQLYGGLPNGSIIKLETSSLWKNEHLTS